MPSRRPSPVPELVAVVASGPGGRTDALVEAVLAPAVAMGAEVLTLHLGHEPSGPDLKEAVAALDGADAFVLGTPTYRGTYTGVLKQFVDLVPRGGPDAGFASPWRAKPIALVATGASEHHFLGLDPLAAMLSRFYAAYVVPPPLYGYRPDDPQAAAAARALGDALLAQAEAVSASDALGAVTPQI